MPATAILNLNNCWFPPPEDADADGLLAIGGDLKTDRLLAAYRQGIFPWFSHDVPLWWHPDPRFVLFPAQLRISKSMKVVFGKKTFSFTKNNAFGEVINACKTVPRPGQDGTWINEEVVSAYTKLHGMGMAHSYEAWQGKTLVGGLYGIKMGKVFFGESMFSRVTNASKAAFIWAVLHLKQDGVELIDCQVYTEHLESLGAEMIARESFMKRLGELVE